MVKAVLYHMDPPGYTCGYRLTKSKYRVIKKQSNEKTANLSIASLRGSKDNRQVHGESI